MRLVACLLLCVFSGLAASPFSDRRHFSKTFSEERNYRIFLPAAYESSAKRYPVIYYCHGHSDRYTLEKYDNGADTVDANVQLGFDVDMRSYDLAAGILRDLGVSSVRLMTNNPQKIAGLEAVGMPVTPQSHWVGESAHSESYLATKKSKLGHLG